MDPYQQPAGPPNGNQYDFITNPGPPTKKSLFPFMNGGSMMKRLFIVLGGAVLLMILAMIAVSIITAGSGSGNASIKQLSLQQDELVRVAGMGSSNAQDLDLRSWSSIAQLSITSQSKDLSKLLADRNIKVTKEERAANKDTQIDKLLDTAAGNNRFDQVFKEEFTQALTDYLQLLKSTYESSSNEGVKSVLSDMYTSAATLLSPTS